MSHSAAVYRNKQLAAIHAAKRALKLEDQEYRDLIERISATKGKPVRSAKLLTPAQLAAVLDEFKRKGAIKPSPKTKGKPANFNSPSMPEMIAKIEAQLADMRLSWAYADAIAKRQFGIERVAWCRTQDQLRAIITALHVEQQKRDLLASIEDVCKRAGISLEQVEARYCLKDIKGWRRNRDRLQAVLFRLKNNFPHAAEAQ